jgi:hypothetical protein
MAGVRNSGDILPVHKPKGLPNDISEVTEFDADKWDVDGHSHSWLSAVELTILDDRWYVMHKDKDRWKENLDLEAHYFGYLFGNSWGGFAKYPNDNPKGLEDVRFVFWFDN